MNRHGLWTMAALMGTVIALVGLVQCVRTGHQLVRERKAEKK